MIISVNGDEMIRRFSNCSNEKKTYHIKGFNVIESGIGIHERYHIKPDATTQIHEYEVLMPERLLKIKPVDVIQREWWPEVRVRGSFIDVVLYDWYIFNGLLTGSFKFIVDGGLIAI